MDAIKVAWLVISCNLRKIPKHNPVYRPLNGGFLICPPHLLNETADSMFSLFITTSVNRNYPCVTGIAVNGGWPLTETVNGNCLVWHRLKCNQRDDRSFFIGIRMVEYKFMNCIDNGVAVILLMLGPSLNSPVERRDPQRVPSLVSDPRWHEQKNTQQVRRRHRRDDDHRELTDNAAWPQQQRLLNTLCCLSGTDRPTFRYSLQGFYGRDTHLRNLHLTKIVQFDWSAVF